MENNNSDSGCCGQCTCGEQQLTVPELKTEVGDTKDYISAFVMASLVSGYPDAGFAENLRVVWGDLCADPTGIVPGQDSWAPLMDQLDIWVGTPGVNFDDLCSEYIDLFDRDRAANPVHETEFGRSRAMFKTTELSDIAGFYRAFAVEFSEDARVREMGDHVSVELEFYAILLMKQAYLTSQGDAEGVEIVEQARKKFLADHLGRFVDAICECNGVKNSTWYSAAFDWIAAVVREECARLDVTPDRAMIHANQREADEVKCGATPALGPNQ